MRTVEELCCYYIATIRAIALIHQNNHWITKGKNFYGNHLLFERIYGTAIEDADAMAEKFIGVFNTDCVDLQIQSKIIQHTLEKHNSDNLIKNSLEAEKEFVEISQHFYDKLKEEERMTLGLDDSIMGVSNNSEARQYLLKQALEERANVVSPIVARINLLKKLKQVKG